MRSIVSAVTVPVAGPSFTVTTAGAQPPATTAYAGVPQAGWQGQATWYAAQGALAPNLSATLYQYSGGASVSGTAAGQVLTFDGSDRATLNLPNGRNAPPDALAVLMAGHAARELIPSKALSFPDFFDRHPPHGGCAAIFFVAVSNL